MANNTSDDELRQKVRSIIEAELSVSEVAAYAAGNKGAVTNIMIEQTMQLIKQRDEQVAREARIDGLLHTLTVLGGESGRLRQVANTVYSVAEYIFELKGEVFNESEYSGYQDVIKQLTTTHKGDQ